MLYVREHTSFDPLLAAEWNRLWFERGNGDIFGTFEWMASWWKCHADAGTGLLLLSVWDDGSLVGVAPLMRRSLRHGILSVNAVEFVSMWRWAGSAGSLLESIDFILGEKRDEIINAILDQIGSRGKTWDILRLHPLRNDSPSLEAVRGWGRRRGFSCTRRPVFDNEVIRIDRGLEEYRKGLSTKFMTGLRQTEARLSRRGSLEYVVVESPAVVPDAWEAMLDIERRSWKWRKGIAINSAAFRGFFREFADAAAEQGWLRLGFLRLNGRDIAYAYLAVTGKNAILLKTSFDEAFTDSSPGSLVMFRTFERIVREGVMRINMLSGDQEYKRKWQTSPEPHCEILVFNRSLRARFLRTLLFRLGFYGKGRVPVMTFKRILRKCGIPWRNSELTREDQLPPRRMSR